MSGSVPRGRAVAAGVASHRATSGGKTGIIGLRCGAVRRLRRCLRLRLCHDVTPADRLSRTLVSFESGQTARTPPQLTKRTELVPVLVLWLCSVKMEHVESVCRARRVLPGRLSGERVHSTRCLPRHT